MYRKGFTVLLLLSCFFLQAGGGILFEHEELSNVAYNSGSFFVVREGIIQREVRELSDVVREMRLNGQASSEGVVWDGKREFTVSGRSFPQYLNLAGHFILLVEMLNPGTTNAFRTERAAGYVDEDKRFFTNALMERGILTDEINLLIDLTSGKQSFYSEAVRVDHKKKKAYQGLLVKKNNELLDQELLAYLNMVDHEMTFIEAHWADQVFANLPLRMATIIISYLAEKDYNGHNRYFHFGARTPDDLQLFRTRLLESKAFYEKAQAKEGPQ